MSPNTWFFSVCGVILIVGGWWFYPYVNQLLAISPVNARYGWLPGIAGLCQWVIAIAWGLVFLAMSGEFNEYMFGPWPDSTLSFG